MFHMLRICESFTHEGVKWKFSSTNDQAYPPSQFIGGVGAEPAQNLPAPQKSYPQWLFLA